MRTIEIDEDIYLHLVQNTKEIGEPASSILRRLIGLTRTPPTSAQGKVAEHELAGAMADPKFLMQSAAVDRFLYLLGIAHNQKKSEFEKILAIQGRDRKYFAKSMEDIMKSGNSTQPRNIPGTTYWAMTNSPTPAKRQMLDDALRLLGYSDAAINAATSTIR